MLAYYVLCIMFIHNTAVILSLDHHHPFENLIKPKSSPECTSTHSCNILDTSKGYRIQTVLDYQTTQIS